MSDNQMREEWIPPIPQSRLKPEPIRCKTAETRSRRTAENADQPRTQARGLPRSWAYFTSDLAPERDIMA